MKRESTIDKAANHPTGEAAGADRRGGAPSGFVVDWATALVERLPAPRRALDVAMGRGRHARVLAGLGFRTFGVDRDVDLILATVRQMRDEGLPLVAWCADLTVAPLPPSTFELVVVTRYLQRDLFDSLRTTVAPGGVVLYETFTTGQLGRAAGPKAPAHLLEPGELRTRFDGFERLFYEEIDGEEAVARIAARRPGRG